MKQKAHNKPSFLILLGSILVTFKNIVVLNNLKPAQPDLPVLFLKWFIPETCGNLKTKWYFAMDRDQLVIGSAHRVTVLILKPWNQIGCHSYFLSYFDSGVASCVLLEQLHKLVSQVDYSENKCSMTNLSQSYLTVAVS